MTAAAEGSYYRARYYDPQVGRFASEDPLAFGGGINFYSYVGNRSTNLIDPSGRQSGLVQSVLDWLFKPVPPPPAVHFPPPPAPTLEFRCSVAGECDFGGWPIQLGGAPDKLVLLVWALQICGIFFLANPL
jgi:hypothetical protein